MRIFFTEKYLEENCIVELEDDNYECQACKQRELKLTRYEMYHSEIKAHCAKKYHKRNVINKEIDQKIAKHIQELENNRIAIEMVNTIQRVHNMCDEFNRKQRLKQLG